MTLNQFQNSLNSINFNGQYNIYIINQFGRRVWIDTASTSFGIKDGIVSIREYGSMEAKQGKQAPSTMQFINVENIKSIGAYQRGLS